MEIKCTLCGALLPVRRTKKNGLYIKCDECKSYFFVSSDSGKAALEAQARGEKTPGSSDFEGFEETIEDEGSKIDWDAPSAPKQEGSSQNSATVFEVKALKKRVTALEEQVSSTAPPAGNPDSEKIVCLACSKEYSKTELLDQDLTGGIVRQEGYRCECGHLLLTKDGEPPAESIIDWES